MKTKNWIIETIDLNKTLLAPKHFEQKLCDLWDLLINNKSSLPKTDLIFVKPVSRLNKKGYSSWD